MSSSLAQHGSERPCRAVARSRCDGCRRFRWLRVTRTLRDRDFRTTRFTCERCGKRGICTLDRPDKEKGMEDYSIAGGATRLMRPDSVLGQSFAPKKLRWKPTR